MRQRKTHETHRGFAALLLSLCAIVSTLAVALPAKAAADDVYVPEAPEGQQAAPTLEEAANMVGDGGTIYLTGDATADMVAFDDKTVTIVSVGPTAYTVTKSGSGENMLVLTGGANVTLQNVVIDATENKGGRTVRVTDGSTLKLSGGAVLENNTAYGAVYLDNSTINVDGGAIQNNRAVKGSTDTKTCTVAGSYSAYTYTAGEGGRQPFGGAVLMVNGSSFEIRSGKLSGNIARSGGAVFASDLRSMSLAGGEISGNSTYYQTETDKALAHGGAISIEKSNSCQVYISGVSVANNTSGYNGGGLYLNWDVGAVDLTMTSGTFSGNHAGRNGATICSFASSPVIDISGTGSVFSDNTSATYGGLYLTKAVEEPMPASDRGVLRIRDGVSFTGNKATYGSCLSVTKNGAINDITLKDCTFRYNSATNNGGAFYTGLCFNATMTIDGGTYENNYSGLSGGAFYAQIDRSSSITIQGGAKFEGNEAKCNAGAFSLKRVGKGDGGTVQLLECDVINNRCNADFENYPGSDREPTMHYNTGGVYVGEDVTCYMYDALITDNSVKDGYEGNTIGSGIGLCPNAAVYLFPEHGATIYGNGDADTMDILAVPYDPVIDHETPAKLYVCDTTPDGQPYNWTDLDGNDARTGQYDWTNVTNDIATVAALDVGSSGETNLDPVGFKANIPNAGIQTVAATGGGTGNYSVRIMNNFTTTALYGGGGVMVNGTVIAGDLEVSIEKRVEGLLPDEAIKKTFNFTFSITEESSYNSSDEANTNGFNGLLKNDDRISITTKKGTDTGTADFIRDPDQRGSLFYPRISTTFELNGGGDKILFSEFEKEGESIFHRNDDGPKGTDINYRFHLEETPVDGVGKTVVKWAIYDTSYKALASGDITNGTDASWSDTSVEPGDVKTIQFIVINTFTELDLTKEVEGEDDKDKLWNFTLTLNESGGAGLSDSYPAELWQDGEKIEDETRLEGAGLTVDPGKATLAVNAGSAQVSLKHGQTLKIKGLPPGSTYEIVENLDHDDNYTSTYDPTYDPEHGKPRGTIPKDGGTVDVRVTNKPKQGDLVVRKTVEGDGGDPQAAFNFRVELTDEKGKKVSGTYGGMEFKDGVAEFTLKSGESKTATGLPADVEYTVTEVEANLNGYKTTETGAKDTIKDGEPATAEFVNSRGKPDVPQTGDESRPGLWALLACAGALGALLLVRRMRREP